MMKFFGNKSSPIGLDIGSHSIKAVQLKRSGSAWTTSASVCLERATPGAAIDLMEMHRVADVLDRRGFVGREVVVSVPTDRLMTSVLELPPRVEGVPIDQIAKLEFARIHKQDPSALTISTWDLPAAARASKTSHVMAVGYLSAQADTFLQPIEDAGLTIVAMDEQSSARARACVSPEAGPAGMTAILDLSWTAGTLSVVKNNKIVYGRSIYEAGLQRLREAMSKSVADNPDLISYMLGTAGLNETPETAHGDIADLRDQINSHCRISPAKCDRHLDTPRISIRTRRLECCCWSAAARWCRAWRSIWKNRWRS